MSLASSAARGSAITLASQAIKLVLMLASTILLARLLSPQDYGLVAMVVAIIGVGEIFRDFGLSMAALQAKDLSQRQQSNLFWINTGVGVLLTAIVIALAHPIAGFYSQPALVDIVYVLSFTFLAGGLSTQFRVHINRQLRFLALAIVDLVPFVLGFVLALIIALAAPSYWALVTQQLVLAAGGLVLSVALARWRPGLPGRAPMRALLSFGVSFAATQVISYATRNLDSVAIGRFWGATPLGMYNRANQLITLPLNQINTPLSRVAIPVLSRISGETERFTAYLRKAQLVALYVTSSIFVIAAALGEQIVILVLGEDWQVAGQLLAILAIGGVFRSIVQISYWIYMAKGMAKEQLRFFLVAQPILIVVILLGLPWGAAGVATTYSLGFGLYWVASLLWVGRVAKLDVRPLFSDAARAVLIFGLPAGLAAFSISLALGEQSPLLRVGAGVIAAVAWFALSTLLFSRIRQDLKILMAFAQLAIRRR